MPQFIAPIYARWRWDDLNPLLGHASLIVAESLYHTLSLFDNVVRGVPPNEVLPYGNSGHYYTFAQLDALGHRFIASRIAFERVQRELTLAYTTGSKAVLPDVWGLKSTSAHDLAVKVLQASSQLVMGWAPATPNTLFARRWDELRQGLEQASDVDGRELVDAMWLEATYADDKCSEELGAPKKLATGLLDLLEQERRETGRLEEPQLETRGYFFVAGEPVIPTQRAVLESEQMESEASEARRAIRTGLRDRLRETAAAVADRLSLSAQEWHFDWSPVMLHTENWDAGAGLAAARVCLRQIKTFAEAGAPGIGAGDSQAAGVRSRRGVAKADGLREPLTGWVAVADAVTYYKLEERHGALRKRLERYRRKHPQDTDNIKETSTPAMREPKFLYSGALVHKHVLELLEE